MRILMVSARCYPYVGGIETHINEVGPRLVGLGHSIDVLTTDPSASLPRHEVVSGMQLRRVQAWPKKRDYYFAPGLVPFIGSGAWDLVHIQGYNTCVAPLAMISALSRNIPFVLTFHSGGHSSRLRGAIRPLQQGLLRPLVVKASKLIGVSKYEADFFSAQMRLAPHMVAVVPNGAELPKPGVRKVMADPNRIVSVGRLERYKGHDNVIRAFAILARDLPNATLQIVGQGPEEAKLRRLVSTLGLQGKVMIAAIPTNERARLSDLLMSAGLFVLLSEYEAHPVAVMEALSLGCPALVSATSGLQELATKYQCRTVPIKATPEEVAVAMAQELLAQKPNRIPLAAPTWDDCARQLSELYTEALECRSSLASDDFRIQSRT